MALDIQNIVNGDLWRTAVNNRFATMKAYLQNIPGTALVAASVGLDRLAKQRAIFTFDTRIEDLSGHANADILDGFKLPQLDTAAYAAWKCYSYSVFARVATAAGSNYLRVKKAAATLKDIDLGALSAGTPARGTLTAADTTATDDEWTIVYVKSGAPTLTDVTLRLFFSAQLVTNY